MSDEKVTCRTPNPDKPGTTNIPKWKFDLLRAAILRELEKGPTPYSDLQTRIGETLPKDRLKDLGSLAWHLISVKLELEVRGEVERVPNQKPQAIRLPQ